MNTSYIVDVLDLFMKMLKKKRRPAMSVKGWWFLEQCPSSLLQSKIGWRPDRSSD
jgi:hypothetical protein